MNLRDEYNVRAKIGSQNFGEFSTNKVLYNERRFDVRIVTHGRYRKTRFLIAIK